MRRTAVAAVVWATALAAAFGGVAAAGPADDRLASAKAGRAEAEAALTALREQVRSERAAAASAIAGLHREIAGAKVDAAAAETERLAAASARDAALDRAAAAVSELEIVTHALAAIGHGTSDLAAIETAAAARIAALASNSGFRVSAVEVVARDGTRATADIYWSGTRPLVVFGTTPVLTGLAERLPDGAIAVSGPTLAPADRDRVRTLGGGANGDLPVDLDGSIARQRDAKPWTLMGWLNDGGFFVWPILAVGLLGAVLGAERAVTLSRAVHRVDHALTVRAVASMAAGSRAEAEALLAGARGPAARILAAGLAATGSHEEREAAIGAAFARELPPLERALTMLGAVAAVAPLLGLLGTVSGMIGTFDVIAGHGAGNPRLLSGGISVALITTQIGLIVAVPALLAHAWISRIVERRTADLEQVANAALAASAGTARSGGAA